MAKRKSKTKKELHEDKKKELDESLDYLRQVDLPESMGGGRKFVGDKLKEDDKKKKKKKDDIQTDLQSKRGAQYTYRERLARYGFEKLLQADLGDDYDGYCIPTDGARINIFGKTFETQEGILVIVKSPKGNVYVRGISMTYNPLYDVKAIDILIVQAENTVDSEKGLLLGDNKDTASTLKRTKSGIYYPN